MNRFFEKTENDKQKQLEEILLTSKNKQEAREKLFEYFKIEGASENENTRTLEIQGVYESIEKLLNSVFNE